MNLFYQPEIRNGILNLDAEESRHAVRVLRMKEGGAIELTDGNGYFYSATITFANPKKCEFEIVGKRNVPKRDFEIHIAMAPTKNMDRMEWFVEKATEIGIDEITFLLTKNSERKAINLDRIKKIATSALKQSQQAWLPIINTIIPFKDILTASSNQKFIAYVDASNPKHLQALAEKAKSYLVLIGPEGDFSKEELSMALQYGFEKVSLGTNRLRTETASIVAVHTLRLVNQPPMNTILI